MAEKPSDEEIMEREERETLDRPWASNDKLTYDRLLSHCSNVDNISAQALQNAVTFTNQMLQEQISKEKNIRDRDQERHGNRTERTTQNMDQYFGYGEEEAVALRMVLEEVRKIGVEVALEKLKS